ncbi:FAD/NAD-P-binding domain-containing protein [Multifurca ochricompacta]|uniref:FAD/NAD-P-binding domain-containing protein n=1 Tax=Multifurca ochricompacta TaxID=376703 RepID=A0AAD4QNW6_9AGAM|nr:FAD/NAD-P-binding domain-containing protein [Multifurca ochricompacta]
MSKANRMNIVVVGGGAAGATIARILSSKINASTTSLTLVTARPFALHLPAAIRLTTTAEGKLEDEVLIPYDQLLVNGNGTIKIGRVTSIDQNKESHSGGSVVLSTGERIRYDILVLAPGAEWDGPLAFPDDRAAVLDHIKSWRRKFENASGIILAGGGAVGCEYAGEIKDVFPRKKVTIVHSDSQLLNSAYPDKYRKRVEKDIISRGVNIVYNDHVDDFESIPATTRSQRPLDGDLVVPTFGSRPGTGFIKSLGSGVLNARGQIKIRPTFQLESYSNIYAIGDVVDWAEQKQAAKAPKHAQIAAANILAQLSGGAPKKTYTGQPELIIITNGKKQGISFMGFLWGITLGNWFSSSMKGKELMISMTRKAYGLSK